MEQQLTLLQCVDFLANGQGAVLYPTEAIFWLIGYRPQVSVSQAHAFLEMAGIENHPAFVKRGDPQAIDGIYALAPDGTSWCLFRIISTTS
jgi:hypothetical protein